jgi:hypothetical protein
MVCALKMSKGAADKVRPELKPFLDELAKLLANAYLRDEAGRRREATMKGFMYIAGSFLTVRRSACGGGKGWIDNDPHFWTSPPTWGICRNDIRRRASPGDYIFFVLPKAAEQPQCLLGYLRVAEKITHDQAFRRPGLRSKRMGNKDVNGNIIVDADGKYNRYDARAHLHIFEKVKQEYVIGDPAHSRFLSEKEIRKLAPRFVLFLKKLIGGKGDRPIDFISRYGRELDAAQVRAVLEWVGA